jgi:hypothetical protein
MTTALEDWRQGDPLTARRFNRITTAIREVQVKSVAQAPESVDLDAAEPVADITWSFVSKTTATERIEDADDDTIFIDVERTLSVVVRTPDGLSIKIELEDPN